MCTGKTLQALRKVKGKSQQELAETRDITQQAISKLEKQKWVDRENVECYLKALKSSWKELEAVEKITPLAE